jgi:hypothetical protein
VVSVLRAGKRSGIRRGLKEEEEVVGGGGWKKAKAEENLKPFVVLRLEKRISGVQAEKFLGFYSFRKFRTLTYQ